jgi:glyoxylase-like metal-dependent hydrolase (beta-lactamase superfamily II)
MPARLDVLCTGYAAERVASTVVLIRDGTAAIVVDPGMVAARRQILDPLSWLGVEPGAVTDVVLSHHHPDHTLNAALFVRARVHDFWAIYEGDSWTDRPADGFALSPSVRLMATPGHTTQDISTLADTDGGLVACTHLWWSREGPEHDPLAEDQALLERSRARLLALSPALIVPGHGAPFSPVRCPSREQEPCSQRLPTHFGTVEHDLGTMH